MGVSCIADLRDRMRYISGESPARLVGREECVMPLRRDYLDYIRTAASSASRAAFHNHLARWRQTFDASNPLGYAAPGFPSTYARLHGFLYRLDGDPAHVREAVHGLLAYLPIAAEIPEAVRTSR